MKQKILLTDVCKKLSTYSEKELEQFFRSFFTKKEIQTLKGRINLIRLLLEKVPQREISKELEISFTLITRGSHELKNGIGKEFFPKFFNKK